MTNARIATLAGLLIAIVAAIFVLQRQSQAKLRRENASLREQTIRLGSTNKVLSDLMAQVDTGSAATSPLQELLDLRAEVARLRADSAELAESNAAARMNDPTNRVALLKQRLEEMPDRRIPELTLLTEQDWRMLAADVLKTDEDFRAAFSRLRETAKQRFVRFELGPALHRYAQANEGRLPDSLSELKPFFSVPLDDAVFRRYELKQTGRLSDVPQVGTYPPASAGTAARALEDKLRSAQKPALPWTEPVVVEKAPVDDQYDSLFTVTVYGYSYQRLGRGTGTGFGTWAKIGTNGLPELILPRQ